MKKILVIMGLLLLAACKPSVMSYDEFLETLEIEAPLEKLRIKNYNTDNICTLLLDGAPYLESILATVEFVRENLGEQFYQEATAKLEGGITYNAKKSNRISGHYNAHTNTIELYESLFEFGCIEEVASTLIHEMVHALQQERHRRPGKQLGEHNLLGKEKDALLAELEAELYQLYLGDKLKLTGFAHTKKIVNLANERRIQFNELMSTPGNPLTAVFQ